MVLKSQININFVLFLSLSLSLSLSPSLYLSLHLSVSLSIYLVTSWLEKPEQDVEFEKFKGDNVSFECGAKGFPLHVEWKFQKRGEETTHSVTGAFKSLV